MKNLVILVAVILFSSCVTCQATVMSKRDVIVCRGIWYVIVLLSLFGLSISLNLLWPPGGKSSSSSSSRFRRDGAVSATTFYAVTLLRSLFSTDPPSTNCYKDFTTEKERIPQLIFAELAMLALVVSPLLYTILVDKVSFWYMILFTISLFTGGIGLIQVSEKFRMEMRHAYFTLFTGWLCYLIGIYMSISLNMLMIAFLIVVFWMLCFWIIRHNLYRDNGLNTSSPSPLPS